MPAEAAASLFGACIDHIHRAMLLIAVNRLSVHQQLRKAWAESPGAIAMAVAIILAAMAGITLARPEDHRIAAGPTTDRTADTGRIDELPVFGSQSRRRTPRRRARALKGYTVNLVICSQVTLRADANWRSLGLAIFTADGSDA